MDDNFVKGPGEALSFIFRYCGVPPGMPCFPGFDGPPPGSFHGAAGKLLFNDFLAGSSWMKAS